jgi:protein gp37
MGLRRGAAMSARTGIEWTDATWTPVTGCEQITPGCAHCYAKSEHDRRHAAYLAGKKMAPQYAVPFEKVQLQPQRLTEPLSWQKPRRIFVCSGADLFHDDVPFEYIAQVFAVMSLAERHTFQVLTKRPARMLAFFKWVDDEGARLRDSHIHGSWDGTNVVTLHACEADLGDRFNRALSAVADDFPPAWPLRNVWVGVSVENQRFADVRIPLLLKTPAALRFLSCEPLLEALDIRAYVTTLAGVLCCPRCGFRTNRFSRCPNDDAELTRDIAVDWVIVGGESGSSKERIRPMHPDWARSLRDQCVAAGVPFLFKQWGTFTYRPPNAEAIVLSDDPSDTTSARSNGYFARVGKKRAGRELDGRTWDEFPASEATT